MKKSTTICAVMFLCLGVGLVVAHPHINKTVTATLSDNVTATITYNTTPANEDHAKKSAVGEFVTPRQPRLRLSGDLKAGSVTIPAGEYIIGAIKNGENDWTMGLFPGTLNRGAKADMAKVIKLESMFSTSSGTAPHMLIDISPGSGKFEGRIVLTLHFGSLFLAGALT
jgi:hypothetical protein